MGSAAVLVISIKNILIASAPAVASLSAKSVIFKRSEVYNECDGTDLLFLFAPSVSLTGCHGNIRHL